MATRNIPILLRHGSVPKIRNFALLAGLDAAVRGMLISVMPLTAYDALKDAGYVSRAYFIAGVLSLCVGLMVPWATRHVPRRWMYSTGSLLYIVGAALAIHGGPVAVPMALVANAAATVTTFVCFNAYVLDYVSRSELGRGQSLMMLYAATPWAVGPLLGVSLREVWEPLPFLAAGALALTQLTTFWILRLGNGKQIARAKGPPPNPLAFLARFAGQPRLIAGWLFAVIRSCGWWVYVVYLPIFCIESGLGSNVGGTVLSMSNALLFTTPLILRVVTRIGIRSTVRGAFGICACAFLASAFAAPLPWATVVCMMVGSSMLVVLDAAGGLPFLMAVKPSERTEMAAVYSSFRDVSGILTPGGAWLVLLVAPIPGVFLLCSAGLAAAWSIAGRLHPRLGAPRPSHGRLMPGE